MPQLSAFPDDEPKEPGSAIASPDTLTSRGSGLSAFPDEAPDRLSDGMRRAPATPADAAARAFNLQIKTDLPVDVIRRNLDALEQQTAATDFDPVAFRQRAPKLAGWIESHPDHGALVQDDIVPLTALEKALNFGDAALDFGKEAGFSLAAGFAEHANLGAWGALEAAGDVLGMPALRDYGKARGKEARELGAALRGDQGNLGATGRAALGGFESVGAAAPILLSTLITKNPTQALALMGLQTGGASYSEARDAGVGIVPALGYGLSQGAIEAATEKLPVEALVGDLAARSGLLKTLAHQLVTEVPGEELATALQDLNEWAILHPDKPFGDYLAARPGAFWETFVSTVVATGAQTGATHSLDRLMAGDRGKRFSEELGAATKETKLAGRSPEKFAELVDKMAEDSPARELYVPVENLTEFYQQQGLDPESAVAALTGNREAYREALQTGADIAIPVARYATKIAATDANAYFADVVRLAPGEMNAQERQAFLEQARTAEPTPAGAEPAPAPGGEVLARITNALTAAGVKPDVAARYARLYDAVFQHGLVQRAGLDPIATFERYGLTFDRKTFADAGLEDALAKAAAARKDAGRPAAGQPASSTAEPDVPRGTLSGEAGTGSPAGLPAGLEDVEGLADVLVGLGTASLTEAPTGSEAANASGESAASLEALSRGEGMAARGETFVVYDRAGNERPLIGPDAVDYTAKAGETYGVRTPTGFRLLEDRGGKVPAEVSSPRGAQTGARPGDAGGERGRPDANRRPEAGGDGAGSQRRRLPTVLELAERDGDTPFEPATAEQDAARFTPEHVRELERIAEELQALQFEGRTWTFTDYRSDKTGGNYEIAAGGAGSPVLDDVLEFSPLSKGQGGKGAAKQVRGTRTQIAQAIAKALETRRIKTNLVEGAMRVAERRAADDYREISRPSLPATWGEEVTPAFVDELSTLVDRQIEELGLDAAALDGVGDATFDPSTLEQRDQNADPGDGLPGGAIAEDLETGEHAIKIGESFLVLATPVPDVDVAGHSLPEGFLYVMDAKATPPRQGIGRCFYAAATVYAQRLGYKGISSTSEARSEAAEGAWAAFKRDGAVKKLGAFDVMTSLGPHPDRFYTSELEQRDRSRIGDVLAAAKTPEERIAIGTEPYERVQAFAQELKARTPGLEKLALAINPDNTLYLEMFVVSPKEQRQGIGSGVMREILAFADREGLTMSLTPAQKGDPGGTTSAARLREFYKRFGFVENKGRTKNDEIDARMYRYPRPTTLEQRDKQTIDLLDTGEEQPRLPGAEDVRDQNIPTPTFEAPFALTSPIAKPEKGRRAAPAPSPEYTAALEASRTASQAFTNATRQYRAGEISDAQFLEARATNEAAQTAFDEAFAKEEALAAQRGRATLFAAPKLEAQGVIQFGADRKFTIRLFEKANLSTVLHESGHFYLELMGDAVDAINAIPAEQRTEAQNGILADYAALVPWLGDAGGEPIAHSRFTRQQQEKFARGFEAYLLEGRAPSEALAPAFQKFRQWLGEIYKTLLGLERAAGERLDLTPEVRDVFDRLLASDAQIAKARQEQIPIFTTAADAGMGEREFALYRGQIEKANLKTQEELDQKLMADVRRQRTAAYKAQREAVESAVVEELNAAPVYRALAAMRYGTNPDGSSVVEGEAAVPIKLSRKMLVEQVGETRTKALPRPAIYSSEGGIDPKLAAEMFGFDSVDKMLNEIEHATPYPEVVKGETDRRMVEQYGDLLLDGGLADARRAASANEEREIVIRAEIRALEALRRQVGPFAREAARAATVDATKERDYERQWFEAEAKLRIAIAEGRKQVEIDRLTKEVARLKARTRGAVPAITRGIPNARLLRDAAQVKIGATTVENIRPRLWFEAARRNGQQAQEAAARQDFDAARDFKVQELFSLALYREATQVLETLERRVGKARDLAKPAARARLGIAGDTYLDQIDGILDRLEFAKVSAKALERRARIAKFVAAHEGLGLPVELPAEVLDDARRVNYKKLTVDELTGALDGIDQIIHLSRLKNRLLKARDKRDLDEKAADLSASIRAKTKPTKRAVARDRRPTDERMRAVDGYFASHVKLSTILQDLDGFEEGGPMWEAVGRAVNDSGNEEASENEKAAVALHALVEAAFPGSAKFALYEKVEVPAVGRSLSRMERIMVAMNYGNEGNKERIHEGEGWNEQQAQAVIDTLEKGDLDFVQGVFDYFETFRPAIAAKQKRITGLEPTWVEATPIKTRHGEYRGGYFPIKADDRLSASAAAKLDLDAANIAKLAAFTRPTTKRGHLEERKGGRDPVRLDFGTIFEHTAQVIHDLTHHEMLIDVGRILGHRDVQAAIYETKGDQVYKDLKAHLRDIALGDIPAQDGFEKGLAHARTGATVVGLGWSLTTPLYQPLGLTVSWQAIGGKWVAKGIGRWLRDSASMNSTVSWVHERSTFMRLRHKTMQREINEIRNSIGVETGRFSAAVDQAFQWASFGLADKQAIADSYFFLIGRAQMIADIPTWIGAYEKAMASGSDDARAVALADQAVLDTQGGGQIKDLAPVQKGGAAKKLWTNFYSAFNVFYNQAVKAGRAKNLRNPVEIGRLAADYFLIYIAPATLTYALPELAHAFLGGGDDKDKEGFWAGLIRANLSYAMGSMIGLRELSSAVQGYAGYDGPAGARGFAAAARLVRQTDQWVSSGFDHTKLDAAFWRSLADTAGVWLHFPIGQVRRTIEGTAQYIEGKTHDPTAIVAGPQR